MDVTTALVTIVGALIAVGGTLAGVRLQQRSTEAAERAGRAERRREDQRAAFRALLATARVHRRAIYTRWQTRTADEERRLGAKYAAWETRSDLSAALDDLHLLVDDAELLRLAEDFVVAVFGLKLRGENLGHLTQALFDERSARAGAAEEAFRAAARRSLGV